MSKMRIFHQLRSSFRVADHPGDLRPPITTSAFLRTEELALGEVGPDV
jgi:hypothetical protein